MNGTIIALNITPEDIKLAEIREENSEKTIQRLFHRRLGSEAGRDPINAVDAIRMFIEEDEPGTLDSVLVVNSQDLEYKDFSFPFHSKKKVVEAIGFEISSGYPPADYIFDHIRSISREPGKNSFLAAIAERSKLKRRITEAEDAGLRVKGITTDISTLGNYFHDMDEALVMEMGESQTLFSLYMHGVPVLVRGIPIGIGKLREGPEGFDRGRLRPLTSEIKRTLHSFSAKTGLDLNSVYVTGNILIDGEILDGLTQALELEFIKQRPRNEDLRPADRRDDLNIYASVLGATEWKKNGKSFNFLKDEFAREDPVAVGRIYLRWAFLTLAFFLFALFLSSGLKIMVLEKRKGFLSAETRKTFQAAFPQTEKIVDEVGQARNFLNAASFQSGQGNPTSGPSVLDVFELLSSAIPQGTDFEILSFFWERGKAEINGRTDSFQTVNIIQELLSGVQAFSEVNISNAKQRNDGENVEFKATIRLAK